MSSLGENEKHLLAFYNEIFKAAYDDKYKHLEEEIEYDTKGRGDHFIGDMLGNIDHVGDENQMLDEKSIQFVLDNLVYRKFVIYPDESSVVYFEEYDYETNSAIMMKYDANVIYYLVIDPNTFNENWKKIDKLVQEKTDIIKKNNILPPKYINHRIKKLQEHYKTVLNIISKREDYLNNMRTSIR